MENDYISKKCKRCDEGIRLPGEYTENSNFAKLCQVSCPNNCKTYTYDSILKKWWR